ncbi:unnamed protein product [marine sediment metagenome]|uniref:Uncharacterized protein n=1 Tax=marine sediment metagenome TaxID=412755 RepID=X1BQK6_9ZZZZ
MPCNIQDNRRRKKWQNNQAENSPCICDLGFAKAGCVARQWWIRWTEAQLDTKWLWLNAGAVLTYDAFFLGNGCQYNFDTGANENIQLLILGSNDPFDDDDLGTITVRISIQIRSGPFPPVPTQTFIDESDAGRFQPQPTVISAERYI